MCKHVILNQSGIRPVKKEFEFLVITDFSDTSCLALEYAMSIAKLIKCSIHVCHVANTKNIVDSENQLAALREIKLAESRIKSKLASIAGMIKTEGIHATTYYSLGNQISELVSHIEYKTPDLIVIGRKHHKTKWPGKLTRFLMNRYTGSLIVTGQKTEFNVNTKMAFGCKEKTLIEYNYSLILTMAKHLGAGLDVINVGVSNEMDVNMKLHGVKDLLNEKDADLSFEFVKGEDVVQRLIEYILDNNIQLFCIGKGKQSGFIQNLIRRQSSITDEIVEKVDIPVLMVGAG